MAVYEIVFDIWISFNLQTLLRLIKYPMQCRHMFVFSTWN